MPELLASDIGGLGAGWLFAAVPGALAVAVAIAGALCGAWFVVRYERAVRRRLMAAAGGTLGAATIAGGFAADVLTLRDDAFERGALYLAVSLGAWVLAASASAWFVDSQRDDGNHKHPRPASFAAAARPAFDDRITYGFAAMLCAVLAYGFMATGTSAQMRLAALVASCVLVSALGIRMMTGGRFPASSSRPSTTRPRTVVARPDAGYFLRVGLAGIPDETLVAACAGETFDAACLFPLETRYGATHGSHDAAWLSALPRRRRDRYGGAAPTRGGCAHGRARTAKRPSFGHA